METFSSLDNIDYFCNEKGIPYRSVPSRLEELLGEVSRWGSRVSNYKEPFSYREYAEYYVRALAKDNRVVASDFTGPMEYVEPEQTPFVSPAPTVTPK